MSRHERYDARDRGFSNWHRYACSDDAFMVDIDGMESCSRKGCRTPLLLIETARDIGQDFKPVTALIGLARKADVPAVVLLWKPSATWQDESPHCPCMRDKRRHEGCDHGIASFRAQHIYPRRTRLTEVEAGSIADWIDRLHKAHAESHHTTISGRVAS